MNKEKFPRTIACWSQAQTSLVRKWEMPNDLPSTAPPRQQPKATSPDQKSEGRTECPPSPTHAMVEPVWEAWPLDLWVR